jgi:hypothetical protein
MLLQDVKVGQTIAFFYNSHGETAYRFLEVEEANEEQVFGRDLEKDAPRRFNGFSMEPPYTCRLICEANRRLISPSTFIRTDRVNCDDETLIQIYSLLNPEDKDVVIQDGWISVENEPAGFIAVNQCRDGLHCISFTNQDGDELEFTRCLKSEPMPLSTSDIRAIINHFT